MKLLLAGALLIGATQASAEPLWNDIEAGMTREQVTALYPRRARGAPRGDRDGIHYSDRSEFRAALTPDCGARAIVSYSRAGIVARVELSNSTNRPCSAALIHSQLLERYGPPARDHQSAETVPGNRFLPFSRQVEHSTQQWLARGVSMTLQLQGTVDPYWTLTYEPVPAGVSLPL